MTPASQRPARLRLSALLAAALVLGVAAPSVAQQPATPSDEQQPVTGRVVKQGQGVAGAAVTLHRVTRDSAGAIATQVADDDGSFSFRRPPNDSTGFTVLFATTEYAGVRYYGPPAHPGDSIAEYTIEVFDTVLVTQPSSQLRLRRRDLVVLPQEDGGWEVNEILLIENPDAVTYVSRSGIPSWEFRLPNRVTAFEVGDGQFSAEEVKRMDDRVLLTAPFTPGARELFIRYRLPPEAADFVLPTAQRTESLNLFVRQPAPQVDVRGLAPAEPVTEQGETFLHFAGTGLGAGSSVSVETAGAPPADPIRATIALTLLVLGGGAWVAARGRRTPRQPR